jgi:hypothetical protein
MNSIHRRRAIAAVAGLGLAAGAAAVACKPSGHPWPPRPTTTTTATTSPQPTIVGGAIDCGRLNGDSGYPTTLYEPLDRGPGKCFLDAWAAGTPAVLVTYRLTSGVPPTPGAPTTYPNSHVTRVTYVITGGGRVTVTTETADGPVQQECTSITHDTTRLTVGGCSPLPPSAPPFDGRNCGTIAYASGWPTTFLVSLETGVGQCFLDAWAAGTPARLVTRDQTDGQGGHIAITTYDVLGPGQLRVTTDGRQRATPQPVTTELCTGLTHDASRLHPENCRPA